MSSLLLMLTVWHCMRGSGNMSTYSCGDKTIRPWSFIWILATMKAAWKPQDWLHKQFKFKTTFDYRSLAFSTTVGCSFAAMETSCVTVFTSDNNKKWIPYVLTFCSCGDCGVGFSISLFVVTTCNGVWPSEHAKFTSAPYPTRASTILECSRSATKRNGVVRCKWFLAFRSQVLWNGIPKHMCRKTIPSWLHLITLINSYTT